MEDLILSLDRALGAFASATATQDQKHIKPVHQYVACRLVCEGGFLPEEIVPRPPIQATKKGGDWRLECAVDSGGSGEMTIFGGMKTKQVDVVVNRDRMGPVMAVSVKGTVKAYRNLSNRMEEAIGDSTNVHVMYPGLVYGFLHFLRANRDTDDRRDYAIGPEGTVSPLVERYAAALLEMTGRTYVRNDYTRYEAVALCLVERTDQGTVSINEEYPSLDSPLRPADFFGKMYRIYDLRFPLRATNLPYCRRHQWSEDSPLFAEWPSDCDYTPRLA